MAHESVIHNSCGMDECETFCLAVIEEVHEGLYNCQRKEWWYCYNGDETWSPCDKPEEEKNVIAFGIG